MLKCYVKKCQHIYFSLMKHEITIPTNEDPMASMTQMTQMESSHHNQVWKNEIKHPINYQTF